MHSVLRLLLALLSLLGLYLVQILLEFWKGVRSIGHLSGPRVLISPSSALAQLIRRALPPPLRFVIRENSWIVKNFYQDFATAGQDAIAMDVTSSRARFPKPVELYEILMVFGGNIVASEGEEWKRYRTIAAPAFSERNTRLVWDETIRIMFDLFDNVWGDKPEIVCDHCVDITLPVGQVSILPHIFSQLSLSDCSFCFGRRVTWTSDLTVPAGHQMTFKDALHVTSTSLILKLILPSWTMKLTERTRKADLAINELKQYMVEMVNTRRNAETKEERYDLFSGLLDAAEGDLDGAAAITEEELIGKCYFSYDIVHEKNVLYETLRMLPTEVMPSQVSSLPKRAAEDTTLTVNNADGGKTTFPVPAGTDIVFHAPGLHYNPTYWKDPYTFRPQRFLEDYPRDAFLPFSAGARACLGRRFFETESIAVITMMMLKYRVEVKQEPEFAGETLEQRFARITASEQYLTNTPDRVPLVFKRR
ncbi:cytochrome P450 [Lactarius tabidus]